MEGSKGEPAFEVTARPANPNLPFVRAIKTAPGVRLIFLSGCLGTQSETADPATTRPQTVEEEAERVFARMRDVLAASGATFADVVKITTYMRDLDDHPVVVQAMRRCFGEHLPTSTTVQVERLVPPGYGIEIEALAVVHDA
jgi:2-iminobutanoate/2-iminopropanoate deaminase